MEDTQVIVSTQYSNESKPDMYLNIDSMSNFKDLLKSLQDNDVLNIIDSITFDSQSQTIIIRMQKLLKEEADEIQRQHTVEGNAMEEDSTDAKISKLSETYKDKYPELLTYFKEWKPCREELINILRSASNSLQRNSICVSGFRILTSAADIFGTLGRVGGQLENSWAGFAMEYASTFGVLALFLDMILSKKIHKEIKKALKKDKERFKKIIEWFKQTEELDTTIKSFFPYGIDPDIVQKIERCSPNFDDYNKIFMSIVASNVKKNVKLFKNKEFLDKADQVATSEAGKQWFHKVILENDPCMKHRLNSDLCEEIEDLLKSINQELSPTENNAMYVEACRALASKAKIKVALNAITIMTSASNILFEARHEVLEHLEELAEITKKEMAEIRNVVRLLKPSELQVDSTLE